MSLLVVVPTRGRPIAAAQLALAARETVSDRRTELLFCVDNDDPMLTKYLDVEPELLVRIGPPEKIGPLVNLVVAGLASLYSHIGFLGDDHRPRTKGWDVELCTDGVAYGNDLIQGPALPTSVVMASWIPLRLGYFNPPGLMHSYLDNAWKAYGETVGLTYRPDIVIEHLHPIAGRAEVDDTYSQAWALASQDKAAWEHYCRTRLPADQEKLRAT